MLNLAPHEVKFVYPTLGSSRIGQTGAALTRLGADTQSYD